MERLLIDYDELYEHLGLTLLDRKGDEDRFRCPDFFGLHKNGDRTGKLYINRSKNVAQCWICGGFTLAQLIAHIKGTEVAEGSSWLKDFSKGEVDNASFLEYLEGLFDVKEETSKALPYFNESILDGWSEGHPFFKERGISEAVRQEYRCGYDPVNDAIVFPHFWQGKLVGWQRRNLSSQPKYKFSDGCPRKETLWGFDQAAHMPMLVESVPTALRLITEGYYSIATFGSLVSDEQIRYLRKFSDGIVLAPDNDPPGEKWLKAIFDGLNDFIPLYRVGLVEGSGADLGDLPKSMLISHINSTFQLLLSLDWRLNL